MRIISTFKDYYDCLKVYGQQDDLTYMRISKKIILSKNNYERGNFKKLYFGFCGKLYRAVDNYLVGPTGYKPAYSFNTEELDRVVEASKYYNIKQDYARVTKIGRIASKFFAGVRGSRQAEEHWFNENNNENNDYNKTLKKYFDKHKSPIFVIYHEGNAEILELNPRLNQYGFQRVMPPYKAYQELVMWLGSQAMPEKPIPTVSDKDLAEAKGFDKFSFRKTKS